MKEPIAHRAGESEKDVLVPDFLIRISAPRTGQERYAVEATIGGDSFFFGGSLDLDEERLRTVMLDNRAYGEALYRALFSEPIERAYQRARGIAEATTDRRMRLRLQIDPDASTLHALHWERLSLPQRDGAVPLSVSGQTPFSRFISRESRIGKPLTRRPVRMAVAISNPSNLPAGLVPIDVEQEIDSLGQSLREVHMPGKLEIAILPGRTGLPNALRERLKQDALTVHDGAMTLETLQQQLLSCDLLHFLGHGVFVPCTLAGTSALFLEKPDGSLDAVKDDEIVALLGDGSKVPRLVFLAACESAKRSDKTAEAFVGLGPKLVRMGVPAVVGMQDLVPMQLARQLTAGFYQRLLDHGVIDQALNEARLLLYDSEYTDWSIPVLFMRIRNGRLFALDPMRTLLQKTAEQADAFFSDKDPPLPLDVGDQDPSALYRLHTSDSPGDAFDVALSEVFASGRDDRCRVLVLSGEPGMAKSTHLRHLAGRLAKRALLTPGPTAIVPLYTHLTNYFKLDIGFRDSVRAFLSRSLQQLSPGVDDDRFSAWLEDPSGPTFLFLIDGADRLDDGQRMAVLERLGELANRPSRHWFLVVGDLSDFSGPSLPVSDYLIVKPIGETRLKT